MAVETEGLRLKASPGKKLSIPYLKNKSDVVVYACNPRYWRGRDKKIQKTLSGGEKKSLDLVSNSIKVKSKSPTLLETDT
jgi:hypothetical protein